MDRVESIEEDMATDPLEAFVSLTVGLGLGFLLESRSFPGHEEATGAYTALEKEELSAAVAEGVEQLDERERTILTLHYFHHISFVDIAAQLGVTKGRISQLHERAIEQLRARLAGLVLADY